MGLLDGVIGSVIGNMMGGAGGQQAMGGGQAANPLMNIAFQLMQKNGGMSGMMDMLKQGGLGQQADSWVSQGQNQGVTGDMLKSVLGSGVLGQMGAQHGMDANQVSGGLASMLPELINQMSPQGKVPDDHNDLISQGLAMLMGKK